MVVVNSERAKKLVQNPLAFRARPEGNMKRYPSDDFDLWVSLETEGSNVKNLSYSGTLPAHKLALFEALAQLIKNKKWSTISHISLRECEAFLRDRNSQTAIDGLDHNEEQSFRKFLTWLQLFPLEKPPQDYQYSDVKGPFHLLKLVDKIKELKAFFNSPEILELYAEVPRPELVDVDDLTVYILAPYNTQKERELFEKLHLLGISTFQEENLNFIPES